MPDFTVPPTARPTRTQRRWSWLHVRYTIYIVTLISLPLLALYCRFTPSGLKLFSLLYLGMSSDSPYQELADAFGRLIKFIGIGYLITIVCNMIVVKRYPPHEGTVTFGAIWLVMMTPLVVVIGSVQLYALLH